MSELDGLAMLGQQRAKATSARKVKGSPSDSSARRTIQPRHPAPPRQIHPTETPVQPAERASSAPAAEVTAPTRPTESSPASQELVRSTLYMDRELDAWLQEVSILGRAATPRIDITRSAVVRYALERLRQEMPTDEVFAELARRQPSASNKPGRKRI